MRRRAADGSPRAGRKTDARARFPRYAGDDGSRRRRALRLLRALDRGLPSAALFRICGASTSLTPVAGLSSLPRPALQPVLAASCL